MSETDQKETNEKAKKKGSMLIIILVAVLALGGGIGGTWFMLKDQMMTEDGAVKEPKITSTFMDLDIFTVNLQPEDGKHYLQVGLTVKILQTKINEEIKKQMPEIRNRILMLLSSKKPSEISTIDGKQALSSEITSAIKDSIDSEAMQEEILGVLFTSFVIQ